MTSLIDRFLKYVSIETTSSEDSNTFPSTSGQLELGRILANELRSVGVDEVDYDEYYGYVYAKIKATEGLENEPVIGFLAHMDTSSEASGKNVLVKRIPNYDGGDVVLNEELGIVLSPTDFPELTNSIGKTLIVTDGTTLLGADDKAGIAEIMTMAETLCSPNAPLHGEIAICFTPDEEIGSGVDYINLDRFGAKFAYTVDGGKLGELEYENFNAAYAKITINGRSVHPGDAKDKMVNAIRVGNELDSLIPSSERPETTEMYEGFYHLESFEGSVEKATLEYIIRDHDLDIFENKKQFITSLVSKLNEKYGPSAVELELKDQYYNMVSKIKPDNMFLIDNVAKKMKELGIEPITKPIRGGTDGARLSFMGLPCPNICTGGMNFHGRFEYAVLEDMELISKLLISIASVK